MKDESDFKLQFLTSVLDLFVYSTYRRPPYVYRFSEILRLLQRWVHESFSNFLLISYNAMMSDFRWEINRSCDDVLAYNERNFSVERFRAALSVVS